MSSDRKQGKPWARGLFTGAVVTFLAAALLLLFINSSPDKTTSVATVVLAVFAAVQVVLAHLSAAEAREAEATRCEGILSMASVKLKRLSERKWRPGYDDVRYVASLSELDDVEQDLEKIIAPGATAERRHVERAIRGLAHVREAKRVQSSDQEALQSPHHERPLMPVVARELDVARRALDPIDLPTELPK